MTDILTCKYGLLEWLLPRSTVGLTGRYGVVIRHPYEHVKKRPDSNHTVLCLHSIRSHVSSCGERKDVGIYMSYSTRVCRPVLL